MCRAFWKMGVSSGIWEVVAGSPQRSRATTRAVGGVVGVGDEWDRARERVERAVEGGVRRSIYGPWGLVAGRGGGGEVRYREDEVRPHRQRNGTSFILPDGSEDGADVGFRGGEGARGGAQLEVDDAVGGEVAEDGEGRGGEGRGVVDEVVDVGREDGEEGGEVVCGVGLARGEGEEGVREGEGGVGGFLLEPDGVEGLRADAAAEVGVELGKGLVRGGEGGGGGWTCFDLGEGLEVKGWVGGCCCCHDAGLLLGHVSKDVLWLRLRKLICGNEVRLRPISRHQAGPNGFGSGVPCGASGDCRSCGRLTLPRRRDHTSTQSNR